MAPQSPPSRCSPSTGLTGRSWASQEPVLATGKPQVRTKLNLLQLVLMAALMYPLTIRYGIMGAAIAAMLPSVLIVFLMLREAGKIIGESFTFIARLF